MGRTLNGAIRRCVPFAIRASSSGSIRVGLDVWNKKRAPDSPEPTKSASFTPCSSLLRLRPSFPPFGFGAAQLRQSSVASPHTRGVLLPRSPAQGDGGFFTSGISSTCCGSRPDVGSLNAGSTQTLRFGAISRSPPPYWTVPVWGGGDLRNGAMRVSNLIRVCPRSLRATRTNVRSTILLLGEAAGWPNFKGANLPSLVKSKFLQ